jgi:hypothetical protein
MANAQRACASDKIALGDEVRAGYHSRGCVMEWCGSITSLLLILAPETWGRAIVCESITFVRRCGCYRSV